MSRKIDSHELWLLVFQVLSYDQWQKLLFIDRNSSSINLIFLLSFRFRIFFFCCYALADTVMFVAFFILVFMLVSNLEFIHLSRISSGTNWKQSRRKWKENMLGKVTLIKNRAGVKNKMLREKYIAQIAQKILGNFLWVPEFLCNTWAYKRGNLIARVLRD